LAGAAFALYSAPHQLLSGKFQKNDKKPEILTTKLK